MLRVSVIATMSFLLLACGVVPTGGAQERRPNSPVPTLAGAPRSASEVEAAVRAALRQTRVKAATVAVVHGATPVFGLTVGTRVAPGDAPANDATVFRAASLSKPVFAYLVFTLVNEGSLDLDKPLYQYLPKPLSEYREYADLAADPRYKAITARLTLSHRTGLPNWRWQTKEGKLAFQFKPGEKFLYSGEGYVFLQFIVEHIAGKGLEALARERVFQPLGMTRTSYTWREEYADNCAIDRAPIDKVFGPHFLSVANSAGSLLTTAADYGRFLSVVLTGRGLSGKWREEMLRPQTVVVGKQLFGPAVAAGPATGGERSPFWSLGWGGFKSTAGAVRFHVGYDSPEYENYAAIYLDRNIGMVVLTGGGRGPDSASPRFVRALVGDTDTPFRWMGY